MRVRARARMPLLPPVLRGFGGRLAHRVLHGVDVLLGHRAPKGVDVLGHCVKRGVGKRLGNHVNQGFGGRCRPGAPALQGFGGRYRHGAPVVAGVDGSDAYRAEAEPFTAKRSGTG